MFSSSNDFIEDSLLQNSILYTNCSLGKLGLIFRSKMKQSSPVKTRVQTPTTSEYIEALQVIRAYLEYLGCSHREMDALHILESKSI